MRRSTAAFCTTALALLVAGCDGPQTALSDAGTDAAQLYRIFVVMLIGAVLLWIALNGLFTWVTRFHTGELSPRLAEGVIIGGGIVLPLIVITALLSWGLSIMPDQRAPGDGLVVRVTGEQWWWRVSYEAPGREAVVVSANEVRLPAGQRVEIFLTSDKVIHSFWVPSLGGKMDMFPGSENRMTLRAERPGTYRGQCAEFCGLSHALMAFNAVVLDEAEFDAWLEAEASPTAAGTDDPGAQVFFAEGCGACHRIGGTDAVGAVGPDLTHLASRTSLAAGILPMTPDALAAWIRRPDAVKPGALMPSYTHLTEDQLSALSGWLMRLE